MKLTNEEVAFYNWHIDYGEETVEVAQKRAWEAGIQWERDRIANLNTDTQVANFSMD